MSSMSDYLEGEIRAHIFRTATFTKPTVLAVALCTAATADANTGATITEVPDATGYARQTLNPLDANWSAVSATDGIVKNLAAITFTASGGDWGSITHFAICDSATWGAGNMLFHGVLASAKTINDGDSLVFPIDSIICTFA